MNILNFQSLYQWTPLHIAVREGKESTVNFLVESGANISSKDIDGVNIWDYVPTDGINVVSVAGLGFELNLICRHFRKGPIFQHLCMHAHLVKGATAFPPSEIPTCKVTICALNTSYFFSISGLLCMWQLKKDVVNIF